MRGRLVGYGHAAIALRLAFGLGAHQHIKAARQAGDVLILTCDHLGEVVGDAGQIGQSFLKFGDTVVGLLVHVGSFR